MKSIFYTTLLLLYFISFSSCIKKVDDTPSSTIPCFGSFSCDINGEPFETSGTFDCQSMTFTYTDGQGLLKVGGADCRVKENDFSTVVFDISGVDKIGSYPIGQVNVAFRESVWQSTPHNVEVAGEVIINGFVEDKFSEDYTGGYAEGTFWFTAYNQDTFDTVYVTKGRFCGRF